MKTITTHEHAANFSVCEKKSVRAYCIPWGYKTYKIEVQEKGKYNLSDKIYPETTTDEQIGVYDKIREIYAVLARKIKVKRK